MKMNNLTKEQIARVFAMYIGQECTYPGIEPNRQIKAILTGVSKGDGLETTYKRKKKGCKGDYLAFVPNGNHDSDALHTKLILRPLSAITLDDMEQANSLGMPLDMQFLIQRGYAVPLFIAPNHPDNGKTAIELGIAITS